MSRNDFNPDLEFNFDLSQPFSVVQPVDSTKSFFDQGLDYSHIPGYEPIDPGNFITDDFADFVEFSFDESGTLVAGVEHMQADISDAMQDIQPMQAEPPGNQAMVPSTEEDLESDSCESLFGESSPPEPPTVSGKTPDSETDALEWEINTTLTRDQSHSAHAPAATEGVTQLDGLQFPTPAPRRPEAPRPLQITDNNSNIHVSADTNTNAWANPQPNSGASVDPSRGAHLPPSQNIAPAVLLHYVPSVADSQGTRLPPLPAPPQPRSIERKLQVSEENASRQDSASRIVDTSHVIQQLLSLQNVGHQASVNPIASQTVGAPAQQSGLPSHTSSNRQAVPYRPVKLPPGGGRKKRAPKIDRGAAVLSSYTQVVPRPVFNGEVVDLTQEETPLGARFLGSSSQGQRPAPAAPRINFCFSCGLKQPVVPPVQGPGTVPSRVNFCYKCGVKHLWTPPLTPPHKKAAKAREYKVMKPVN